MNLSVVQKHKRLDGDHDFLVEFELNTDKQYVAFKVTKDHVIANISNVDKETLRVWLPKKRTIKANAKSLVQTYPEILQKSSYSYYDLIRDDTKLRDTLKLEKRKWKVHEVSIWPDGYFIARLSCAVKNNQYVKGSSQFVLHSPRYLSSNGPDDVQLYCRHGSFNSTSHVSKSRLFSAFRSKSQWSGLSKTLNSVEFGYNTEIEAKAGFDYLKGLQESLPTETIKYKNQNSVRQVATDTNINIEVLEEYQNYHEKAWLIKSDNGYCIMRMDSNAHGKVVLINSGITTAFIDVTRSAQHLLSQANEQQKKTLDKATVDKAWKEMIANDVRFRYFCEQLDATWVITDVAMKEGEPIGVQAQCFPAAQFAIPLNAKPLTYRTVFIKDGAVIDPSADKGRQLKRALSESFIAGVKEFLASPSKAINKKLEEVLRNTKGYPTESDSEKSFGSLEYDAAIKIQGGACPIPPSLKLATLNFSIEQHKEKLNEKIGNGDVKPDVLVKFENGIKNRFEHPKQLVAYLKDNDLLFKVNGNEISVDDLKEPEIDVAEVQGNLNADKYISSTTKSNAGRKRIFKDDKERKRVWAKNKREEVKREKLKSGIKPLKVGRKPIYKNQAERQMHYRLKKKWTSLALDSALIIVVGVDDVDNSPLFQQISNISRYFGKRVFIEVKVKGDEENDSELKASIKADISEVIENIDIKNVYFNSSLDLSDQMLSKVKSVDVSTLHISGAGILQHCLPACLSLVNGGYSILLHKDIIKDKSKAAKEKGLSVFKEVLGPHRVM